LVAQALHKHSPKRPGKLWEEQKLPRLFFLLAGRRPLPPEQEQARLQHILSFSTSPEIIIVSEYGDTGESARRLYRVVSALGHPTTFAVLSLSHHAKRTLPNHIPPHKLIYGTVGQEGLDFYDAFFNLVTKPKVDTNTPYAVKKEYYKDSLPGARTRRRALRRIAYTCAAAFSTS